MKHVNVRIVFHNKYIRNNQLYTAITFLFYISVKKDFYIREEDKNTSKNHSLIWFWRLQSIKARSEFISSMAINCKNCVYIYIIIYIYYACNIFGKLACLRELRIIFLIEKKNKAIWEFSNAQNEIHKYSINYFQTSLLKH